MLEKQIPLTECSYMTIPGHIQFCQKVADIEMEKKEMCKKEALAALIFDLCEFFGIDFEKYKDNSHLRNKEYIKIRQFYTYILRNNTKISLKKIGETLDQDHSTVINSLKRMNEFLITDSDFKKEYKSFKIFSYNKHKYYIL